MATKEEQAQVTALHAAQEEPSIWHELEHEIFTALEGRVEPVRSSGEHVSDVYEVVLETGRVAYFKPVTGPTAAGNSLKRALRNYKHTPVSSMISECAAWQLAKHLGGEWAELVRPTVVRYVSLPIGQREPGSLQAFCPGEPRRRGYFQAAPHLARAGAYFDCLIGQQDRNPGNVHWHEGRDRIYLIDHGFSFARSGDPTGHQQLTEWRWRHDQRGLSNEELDANARVLDDDLFGLEAYLEEHRASALRARVVRMNERGEVLRPGET